MERVSQYFRGVEASFRKMRVLVISSLAMAAVIAIGSLVYCGLFISENSNRVYLVDREGAVISGSLSDESRVKTIEVKDHIFRFHQLMFNLIPIHEANMANINAAMYLCDRSAYIFYNDQQESGYYTRLEKNNITQYFMSDSIKVDFTVYPYQEHTYGKLYVQRESTTTMYAFESVGRVVNAGRSVENPHGLMLERFAVIRHEPIETRVR